MFFPKGFIVQIKELRFFKYTNTKGVRNQFYDILNSITKRGLKIAKLEVADWLENDGHCLGLMLVA